MFIDTEKNQQFLALIYSLQNNGSNAVLTPKEHGEKILSKKVYKAYDYNKDKYGKWVYSLEPLPEYISKYNNPEINNGGRPKTLTDEQRQQIKAWKAENISNREIAKRLKVSEGTIRNEIKSIRTDV